MDGWIVALKLDIVTAGLKSPTATVAGNRLHSHKAWSLTLAVH